VQRKSQWPYPGFVGIGLGSRLGSLRIQRNLDGITASSSALFSPLHKTYPNDNNHSSQDKGIGISGLATSESVVCNMREISVSFILLSISTLYFLSKTASFIKNYIAGVRTGYPVCVSPILSHSIPWMILGPMFRPQMELHLPEWIYDRLVILCAGWEFHAGVKMHKKLGKVFVVVTPDECTLW
jgi:hypothetical protein